MNLPHLAKKIKTKLLKTTSRYFAVNKKYKPNGTVGLQQLREKGVDFIEINPPYLSLLRLSEKFVEDCSSYNKPTLSVNYPGDFIVKLCNGRIYNIDAANIAIITEDNFFVDELSFQWRSGEKLASSSENVIFPQNIFSKPRIIAGKVFSLLSGGGAVDYYYHWVIDSISKLYLLKQSGLAEEVEYYLVPNYGHRFQKEYLNVFGIPESKIINANVHRHIQADEIIVASYIRIMAHLPSWVPGFLKNSILKISDSPRRKLLYIARGDAALNRKVLNESEVIVMVQKLGFEICFLSTLSVTEQARLFNSARMIVASHGGGLTNLVYCEAGTSVLEFFPDNYVNHLFYDISVKQKLDYHYMIFRSEHFTGNDLERAAADVTVDLSALEGKIKLLLFQPNE